MHITFCDLCGIELGSGKGVYYAQIRAPGESWASAGRDYSYDLCVKCAKPLTEWKRVHPKRKMTPVEDDE